MVASRWSSPSCVGLPQTRQHPPTSSQPLNIQCSAYTLVPSFENSERPFISYCCFWPTLQGDTPPITHPLLKLCYHYLPHSPQLRRLCRVMVRASYSRNHTLPPPSHHHLLFVNGDLSRSGLQTYFHPQPLLPADTRRTLRFSPLSFDLLGELTRDFD